MLGNWVKIHRKMLDSPIMGHDGLMRLWMFCLLKANWKERKWLMPGTMNEVSVPRGSFLTGRNKLHTKLYGAKYTGEKKSIPSELTLWRWLKRLEKMGCIRVTNMNNRCSMVTICNYTTYQKRDESKRSTDEQLMNNRRTTGEQLVNTIEESKNLRREEVNTLGLAKSENQKSKPEPEAKPDQPPPFAGERSAFDPLVLPMPDVLDCPTFREAWSKWVRYLTAEKSSRFAQATAQAQLASMARDGPTVAIQRIEASIEAGWVKLADKPQDKQRNGKPKRKYITAAESIGSEFEKRF